MDQSSGVNVTTEGLTATSVESLGNTISVTSLSGPASSTTENASVLPPSVTSVAPSVERNEKLPTSSSNEVTWITRSGTG